MPTDDPIDAYLAGVWTLRSAVAGMTPEQLNARPVAGKWSTIEVVAHLADYDLIYAERIKRIIATDRPLLVSADPDPYAANLAYHGRSLDEELDVIEAIRRSTARILRAVGPAALDRVGVYRDGDGSEKDRSAGRLLTIITGHIPHHLKFVQEKRRALGLPEVSALA